MEIAFINGILQSDHFPPQDPWLSGFGISYYYFGYVMMSMATRLAAERLGVRWASSVLSPLSFFSAHDPPVVPLYVWLSALRPLGPLFHRALFGLMRWSIRSVHPPERRAQSWRAGARSAASLASSAPISSRLSPIRCANTMKAIRRSADFG